MENNEIKETKVETELISEFSQELDSNDLLNYNIYRFVLLFIIMSSRVFQDMEKAFENRKNNIY